MLTPTMAPKFVEDPEGAAGLDVDAGGLPVGVEPAGLLEVTMEVRQDVFVPL